MNFFSSNAFLESLALTRFAGKPWSIDDYTVQGQRFRLLTVEDKPITWWPFLDFLEPRLGLQEREPNPPPKILDYLPYAVIGYLPADGEKPAAITPGTQASPLIDWSLLKTPELLEAHIKARRSGLLADSAKRERKLAAALGPVTYAYDDAAEDVFRLGAEWKSSQFMVTGGADWFFRENLPLFAELKRRRVLVMASLRAGGRLVSTIWSGFEDGRLYYWVATYDPSLSAFSPGRLLLEKLMRDSQARGHRELDFLIGDEAYKWHYATHTRVIGHVGTVPLHLRWTKEARTRIKVALGRFPRLLDAAQSLRKRLRL